MAIYYFDSSALVKNYVQEIGTLWVNGLVSPAAGHRIYVASITGVEIVAAFARLGRGGLLPLPIAASALAQFRHDFTKEFRVIDLVMPLIRQAMTLAEKHTLRGYDAVQLAVALAVNSRRLAGGFPGLTLISADNELNVAARLEGLVVDDPNRHP